MGTPRAGPGSCLCLRPPTTPLGSDPKAPVTHRQPQLRAQEARTHHNHRQASSQHGSLCRLVLGLAGSQRWLCQRPRGAAFLEAGLGGGPRGGLWVRPGMPEGPLWRLPWPAGGPRVEREGRGGREGASHVPLSTPTLPPESLPLAHVRIDSFIHPYIRSRLHLLPLSRPLPPPLLPHTSMRHCTPILNDVCDRVVDGASWLSSRNSA